MIRILSYAPTIFLWIVFLCAWFVLFEQSMSSVVAWLCLLAIIPACSLLWFIIVLLSGLIKKSWGQWRTVALITIAFTSSTGLWNVSIGQFPFPLEEEGRKSLTIRVPFQPEAVVAWGGNTLQENYHSFTPDQRWAYDLVIEPAAHGARELDEYGCFGEPVFAPTSGRIHHVQLGLLDQSPLDFAPDYKNPTGNSVWIQPKEGGYLLVAHLKHQSITVEEGQRIKEGEQIGACGNTGNSSEPHVHLHYQEQDPKEFSNNFALGLPLYFHENKGPSSPKGGFRLAGDKIELTGDRIAHISSSPSSVERNPKKEMQGNTETMTTQTITALLVKKSSTNKAGRSLGTDYYLRMSRADIVIKICESAISESDLEERFSDSRDELQIGVPISAVVEFREGEFDGCTEPKEVQSRVGEYAVVHTIH